MKEITASQLPHYEAQLERAGKWVEEVRALLAKADARRAAEPENERNWNRKINELEKALDEARANVTMCEARIIRERQRMRDAAAREARKDKEAADAHKAIIFSRDELIVVKQYLAAWWENQAAAQMGRSSASSSFIYQQRQTCMRNAIEKTTTNQFEAMNLDEVEAALGCFTAIMRRIDGHLQEKRGTGELGGVSEKLEAVCGQLRLRRARVMARKRGL